MMGGRGEFGARTMYVGSGLVVLSTPLSPLHGHVGHPARRGSCSRNRGRVAGVPRCRGGYVYHSEPAKPIVHHHGGRAGLAARTAAAEQVAESGAEHGEQRQQREQQQPAGVRGTGAGAGAANPAPGVSAHLCRH